MSKPIAWFPANVKLSPAIRRGLQKAGYLVLQSEVPPKAVTILPVADGGNILAECALECIQQIKSDGTYYTGANLKAWFVDKVIARTNAAKDGGAGQ